MQAGGAITPGGYCCESGNVDAAGVCDGAGETLRKNVALEGVSNVGSSSGRRLLNVETLKSSIERVIQRELGYETGGAVEDGFAVVTVTARDNGSEVRINSTTVTARRCIAQVGAVHDLTSAQRFTLSHKPPAHTVRCDACSAASSLASQIAGSCTKLACWSASAYLRVPLVHCCIKLISAAVLQVNIDIPPSTTGTALTSPDAIAAALQIAFAAEDPPITAASTSVEVATVCGDGVCSPGEPVIKGEDPDPDSRCPADCPVLLGDCDAPPASGVGDATLPCGGNGLCIASTLTCSCFPGCAHRRTLAFMHAIDQAALSELLHALAFSEQSLFDVPNAATKTDLVLCRLSTSRSVPLQMLQPGRAHSRTTCLCFLDAVRCLMPLQ